MGRASRCVVEGRDTTSLPHPPLRTVRASFPASGSSTTIGLIESSGCMTLLYLTELKSPFWDRLGNFQTKGMDTPVAPRMHQDPILEAVRPTQPHGLDVVVVQ